MGDCQTRGIGDPPSLKLRRGKHGDTEKCAVIANHAGGVMKQSRQYETDAVAALP